MWSRKPTTWSAWPSWSIGSARTLLALSALLLLFAAGSFALEPPAQDQVERAVRETFADPELASGLETSHLDVQELPEGLGAILAALYQRLIKWMRDLAIESPGSLTGMYLLMVLLLAVLVTHIAWSLRQAFRSGGVADPGPDEAVLELRRRSAELRAEAAALAAQGRLREATRLLLLLLLALLDERQVLEVGPGWTNREILARLELPPGLAGDAAAFVAAADEACYGDRAPDPGAFGRLSGLVDRVEGAVRR